MSLISPRYQNGLTKQEYNFMGNEYLFTNNEHDINENNINILTNTDYKYAKNEYDLPRKPRKDNLITEREYDLTINYKHMACSYEYK